MSDTGQIVYQAEKQACRAFPDPKGDGTQAGVKRNFQILPPLDFLAEFTQHKILQHCGLWQASAPRAPPDVDGLVLELEAAYSDSSIGSSDQADPSQELTYVDIDTFLASF